MHDDHDSREWHYTTMVRMIQDSLWPLVESGDLDKLTRGTNPDGFDVSWRGAVLSLRIPLAPFGSEVINTLSRVGLKASVLQVGTNGSYAVFGPPQGKSKERSVIFGTIGDLGEPPYINPESDRAKVADTILTILNAVKPKIVKVS